MGVRRELAVVTPRRTAQEAPVADWEPSLETITISHRFWNIQEVHVTYPCVRILLLGLSTLRLSSLSLTKCGSPIFFCTQPRWM